MTGACWVDRKGECSGGGLCGSCYRGPREPRAEQGVRCGVYGLAFRAGIMRVCRRPEIARRYGDGETAVVSLWGCRKVCELCEVGYRDMPGLIGCGYDPPGELYRLAGEARRRGGRTT